EDYVEQDFISNSGWKALEYPPVQFNPNDSVTVIRAAHLIAYPLKPQNRREHSTSFSGVYNQIYDAGEKYRLVMTFNSEGERGNKPLLRSLRRKYRLRLLFTHFLNHLMKSTLGF